VPAVGADCIVHNTDGCPRTLSVFGLSAAGAGPVYCTTRAPGLMLLSTWQRTDAGVRALKIYCDKELCEASHDGQMRCCVQSAFGACQVLPEEQTACSPSQPPQFSADVPKLAAKCAGMGKRGHGSSTCSVPVKI